MSSITFSQSRPSHLTVWRQIRTFRAQPPGRAGRGERKRVFCSALEQAEQLFTTAGAAGYASRPLLLFYGLSQAGRAIAAASTAADNNSYKLSGHGIKVLDLDQRPPLPELTVKDEGVGSFTQLAQMLGSISLPAGAPLGQLWAIIPDLLATPLDTGSRRHPTALHMTYADHGGTFTTMWIAGFPERPGGYLRMSEEKIQAILRSYPTLARSLHHGGGVTEFGPPPGYEGRYISRTWWDGDHPTELDRPYRDDSDRWVFPAFDDAGNTLHPLLTWWALLFVLSMLARYEPASWIGSLDVNVSPVAVPLEAALDQALATCPELILRAIRAVAI